jgi:hypothetical protein
MDVDPSMSTPLTSSINMMKLIDDVNRAATVPDSCYVLFLFGGVEKQKGHWLQLNRLCP